MKRIMLLSALASVLISTQCKDDAPVQPLSDSLYSGELKMLFFNGGLLQTTSTTLVVDLEAQKFWKKKTGGSGDACTGKIQLDEAAQTADFQAGDCGCWCDCNPFVDCSGDQVLGAFSYELSGDSLFLEKTISYHPSSSYFLEARLGKL